jgi:hypothetical protein
MRYIVGLLTAAGITVLVTACGVLSGPAPAPTPTQPIIINNPSGNDSGTTVLLTVVGVAAFLLLAVAIVAGMGWANERRRRRTAEDTVVTLTGRPINQLALAMAPPISAERLHDMAVPFSPVAEQRKALR